MKTILSYFLLVVLTISCQLKPNRNDDNSVAKDVGSDNQEECIADTVKATAIFWIDKAETKNCEQWGFRTTKARVVIHENGKVSLKSFVKKQSLGAEKYIRHHLAKFQVSEKMFESGCVQPGEQVVQLRCFYEKVNGK
ncbi:DUF4891 domain-containing protein [uncultured Bacteroides sp.]|uniref:DUF4891 domain-containing protein n=1 Tax=uncultured Bacteroides sp. TaxID=162156 RepID=UPI0025F56920|nr:DUF4891 domain-containing protein [uncultured Bacteroides sp.]